MARYFLALVLMLGSAMFVTGDAYAGGFALNEMSAGSLGNAHAGGAALAEDASTIFYNPAGLMRFTGRQASVSVSAIRPSAEFRNNGSTSAIGTPGSGGNGGDAGDWSAVPALFFATDLASGLRFGVGLQAPFGLKTEYDAGWVGRYQALRSELKTINVNPTVAWRLTPQWSLGVGISAQYADVTISRAIDFGTVCIGSLGVANCAPGGFLPQARDGSVKVDGNDWAYGFNLGALFEADRDTRFGMAYRAKIDHHLSGNARYTLPTGLPAPLAASPTFTDSGASADLKLPDTVSLSGYRALDRRWAIMSDITWTHWSRFKELRVNFDNGAASSVTPENWQNTLRVAVAANYRLDDRWLLRGGVAWDESPVKDTYRTPRIPDEDRTWLSFGGRYALSPGAAVDIGYAHLFVKDASINKAEPPVGGTLIGNYKNDVNILSIQYSAAF
ncbi:long-chain fatty acid transport protein [Actimicrobium sp. GrIS 1.19]|uniref:OmpP1/FadL family transporter n=1 Tax=Actimicrobium sp. GrIS 1.19 TaxID=3071708 RepID=UPI002E0B5000|nr:long-chain fatty acid transport protein [Actimicrobium sp. GrIS 1.19]